MRRNANVWDALLLPRGLGPNPWNNARYRAMARALDVWALRFVVLNNVIGLYAVLRKFPPLRTWPRALPCAFYVAAGVVQQLTSRHCPNWYYRHRHHILAAHRLTRIPIIAALPYTIRSWIARSVAQEAIDGYTASQLAPSRNIAAVGFLMALSGAMHTLTHVAALPLPLLPQLFFQAVYLAILVVFQLAPAAHSLDLSPYAPQLQRMCRGLNGALVLLASAHSGIYLHLDELNRICEEQIALQMVLFVQLYFCFVVPLYYAYRLELECSLHMQQAPLPLPPPPPPAPAGQGPAERPEWEPPQEPTSVAVAGDIAVLLSMVMVCWLAAIAALPHLPKVMWPLAQASTAAS